MPAVHGCTPSCYILSEFETRDSEGDTSHLHIQPQTVVRKAAVVVHGSKCLQGIKFAGVEGMSLSMTKLKGVLKAQI